MESETDAIKKDLEKIKLSHGEELQKGQDLIEAQKQLQSKQIATNDEYNKADEKLQQL